MLSLSPRPQPREPREVIDALVRENFWREVVCYAVIGVSALAAGVAAVWGAANGSAWVVGAALGGGSGFLYFPIRSAIFLWRTNSAIRLMEIPLSRAGTAREAALTISEAFPDLFKKEL